MQACVLLDLCKYVCGWQVLNAPGLGGSTGAHLMLESLALGTCLGNETSLVLLMAKKHVY